MRGHAQAGVSTSSGTSAARAGAPAGDTAELVALLNGIRDDLDGARRALEQRG